MATYFEEFSGYTLGNGVPAGWTSIYDTSGLWRVAAVDGLRAIEWDRDGNTDLVHRALSWDTVGSIASANEPVEVAMLVRVSDNSYLTTAGAGIGMHGTDETARGSAGVRSQEDAVGRRLFNTDVNTSPGTVVAWPATTRVWIRMRKNGVTVQAKVWGDGNSEPVDWQHDWETHEPGGHVGPYVRHPRGTDDGVYAWYAIGVGTDGDAAPLSGLDFTLTTSTSGDGTITKTPDSATYAENDEVVVEAVPAAGWEFVGWSGDVEGDVNPQTVTITGSNAVSATFLPSPPTLAGTQTVAVTLTWDETASPYAVRRDGAVIASGLTGTTFYDNDVTVGTSYDYTVEADNETPSNTITVNVGPGGGGVFHLRRTATGWSSDGS